MTNQNQTNEELLDQDEDDVQELPEVTRLDSLKAKAKKMGIKFRDNISEVALSKKIDAAMADEPEEEEETEDDSESEEEKPEVTPKVDPVKKRVADRRRSQRLIRIVVHPVDPRRTQLEGELVMAGNSAVGTTGKFVPFNREEGYHVPEIIYNALKDRTFTEFYIVEDKDGNEHTKSRQKKAFVIEVLDPLTQEQINEIRIRQQATLSGDE